MKKDHPDINSTDRDDHDAEKSLDLIYMEEVLRNNIQTISVGKSTFHKTEQYNLNIFYKHISRSI